MSAKKTVTFFDYEMELGTEMSYLRDSNDLLDDPVALRARITEDGYLLLRGLQRRENVEAARHAILTAFEKRGLVDPNHPLMDGVCHPGKQSDRSRATEEARGSEAFVSLVESPEIMSFFECFLGGEVLTFDYKWLRVVPQGGHTGGIHYDIVYMGRGTQNLYTTWTPLGDVPFEKGPLALLVGSHNLPGFRKLQETYAKSDVDRDHTVGWFSRDPRELTDRFGGQWATTEFRMGDVLIFGMYNMHASLKNTTNTYRLSSDTRYQLACEPADDRWVGKKPKGHYSWHTQEHVSIEESRKTWGV